MNSFPVQCSIVIFLLLFAGFETASVTDGSKGLSELDDEKDPSFLDYRLPKTVIPVNYEIIITLQSEGNFTFKGRAHIEAFIEKPTDTITLHHGEMEISTVSVYYDRQPQKIVSLNYDNKTEKFEIKLGQALNAGINITINFEYTGSIREDMVGFYKSSYVDSNGKIRWLVSTQFQKSYARHAFPCFDEPRFKATFMIRLLRPMGYSCISNMPLNRSLKINDKYWDEFEQSIPMSTYLVAFVVSDFEYLKAGDVRVWARPNAVNQARYALSIGTQALDHLSKRFKQNYQVPKMDMVAVPDFSMGAMENWGLVTYRESRLLYDENSSSAAAQQAIAAVIVHELTHMWFGNTVTPEWWSYLWLSEAFARYFQYIATAQIEKTWNMEEQFVVEQHQTAYAADGVETSQPMTRDVSNSSQMDGIADTITYNKGGSIVRMMNLIFGSDVFDAGLQSYLTNEEKVARPKHLWTALQKEINRQNRQLATSVEEIMTTWTEQAGFPVLHVSMNADGTAVLTQKRFLLRNLKSTPTNVTWWIPLTWATQENPNFDNIKVVNWLSRERDAINVGKIAGWVIFNVQSSGFYRVNYDSASWYKIIDALNSKDYPKIHVLNRAALVDDLLNLARAGLLGYKTALDGLRYLERETNYLPFKAAFSGFAYLDQRLSGNGEYHEQFKEFVLLLIDERYKEVGYVDHPADDRLRVLLRGELNKWACNYGHEKCVATFVRMFQQWKEHNIAIKPNLRPVAYCMGIKYGKKEDWEFLWNQYYNSNSATEQVVLLQALGCTRDAALLEKYMLYALTPFEESRIRMHDNSAVFSAVYGTGPSGAEAVLNFVEKHHVEMTKFYNGTGTISSILSSASQRFSTKALVDKFEALIERRKTEFKAVLKPLRSSLEVARYELLWLERNASPVMSWVKAFNEQHRDTVNDTSDTTDYRLPGSVTPNSYTISVTTDVSELDNFTFTGSVTIDGTVSTRTRSIVLHSSDLTHNGINVLVDNQSVKIAKTNANGKYDFLIIELERELLIGQRVVLTIDFVGHLNEEMRGFYRSSYVGDDQENRWLAATHMEPVGARKMFPCFDEPALKAKFVVKVTVPQVYNAVSNMPIENLYLHTNEMKTIVFKETPRMSTYLVALVVSDFASSKDDDEFYGVWAREGSIAQAGYALSVMKPLVGYYEKTFDIPYRLPKLDMVALPDFVSGAMENWGLLTYKERNVLYDQELSTTASQQATINIISHEITHQWFGNLVSPLWWKYLWLNEGFARYFQFFGTGQIETSWQLESQFVVDHVHSAFETDSSASSHAMSHDVYSPTEIKGIFDTISYAKAASIIRMMERLFGREVFFKSLRNYLKKREYDVATPKDLFDSFKEQITDQQIKNSIHDIMNSWTTQPGYPVVHVTIQGNRAQLKQERFFLNPPEAPSQSTWHVPISWTSLEKMDFEDTKPKYWLKDERATVELPSNDLYLFNVQQAGFYRVNYDRATWLRIIEFLKGNRSDGIHEANSAAIVDDLFHLARAGYVDYDIALPAMRYLVKEKNYAPWRAFFNGITYLYKQFEGRAGFDAFKRYVSAVLTPIYDNLRFTDQPNDTHVTKLLRSHVRKWACKLDVLGCKEEALLYFQYWSNNGLRIPPNYLGVVYCTVAEQNDGFQWRLLWQRYSTSSFAAEKSTILQSLACSTNKNLLTILLEKAISKRSGIRLEDSTGVFTSVVNSSPEGVDCAIDFVKHNYDAMVKYYKQVSSIDSIAGAIGKKVFTVEHYTKYTELLNWLAEKRAAEQSSLNTNLAYRELVWAENNVPRITEWLEKNYRSMDYRLPKTFHPLTYNLSMIPYFEDNFTFTGSVRIELERRSNYASSIVLHANTLAIDKVSVYPKSAIPSNGNQLEISSMVFYTDTQMLWIFLKNFAKSERLMLDIRFSGTLNDKMLGFYRSRYVNAEGKIRWLATTQFQGTYARNAFPCFDEPSFKAKFVVNVERPKDYMVLSNMPRASLTPSDAPGRVWETFQETPLMSTYLLAFTVSDFEPIREPNQKINVWGRPAIVQKGELAEVATRVMLQELLIQTGLKYSLPKVDLVGIPDLFVGGMENWGLVTLREDKLFYDQNITSAKYTDDVIKSIAHELTHTLFGNLVTCDWWEHLWLNEGFAEYLQWLLADSFRMFNGYKDTFVVDELQAAMQIDGLPSTHPMNNPVRTPAEIENTFDGITYGKSACVLRMIHKSMDSGIFWLAVSRYLLQHRYNTTTPKDLWKIYDTAISDWKVTDVWLVSMVKVMDGWTNKPGYPVVEANLNSSRLTLTQKSFFTYENIKDFVIPITLATASDANFETTIASTWMEGEPLTIYMKNPRDWFVVNVQQTGYYRVNYDRDSWLRLIAALKEEQHSKIHVTNRAQIVDDALNLARNGYLSYDIALDVTSYLENETEYPPWKAFFNGLDFLLQRFADRPGHDSVKRYARLLATQVYKKLGFADNNDDSHLDRLNRDSILSWMCKFDEEKCVERAVSLFDEWMETKTNPISPNARTAFYCAAIAHGSKKRTDFLWQQYRETNFVSEKIIILNALGCSNDDQSLISYLSQAISPDETSAIRRQYVGTVFAAVYNRGENGVNAVLSFLLNNYKQLHEYYGDWDGLKELISKLGSRISTGQQISKLTQLLSKSNGNTGMITSINDAVDTAKKNLMWYDKHAPVIRAWLTAKIPTMGDKNGGGRGVPNNLGIIAATVFTVTMYIRSR